jgi:hypothetical protein
MSASLLPFHALADIFPLMEGDEFTELVGDIQRRGLKLPIWMFEGKVLDGRNRVRASDKAGYDLKPTDIKQFEGTTEEAIRFVISMNIHRRQLKPEQRRELLKTLLKVHPELSDRAIAAMAKTHHHAVADARKDAEANGKVSHKDRVERSGRNARGRKPGSGKSKSRSARTEVPKPVGDWTHPIGPPADGSKYRTVVTIEPARPSATEREVVPAEVPTFPQSLASDLPNGTGDYAEAITPSELDTLRTFATFIMVSLRDGALTVTGDPKRMARFRELKERINLLIPTMAKA